jgi:hypothetical protein
MQICDLEHLEVLLKKGVTGSQGTSNTLSLNLSKGLLSLKVGDLELYRKQLTETPSEVLFSYENQADVNALSVLKVGLTPNGGFVIAASSTTVNDSYPPTA